MPAALSLPSLSQIEAISTDHLSQLATDFLAEAQLWGSAFTDIHQQISVADWEGPAHDQASYRSDTDRVKVVGLSETLRDTSGVATTGVEELHFARARVLNAVSEARAAGFEVGDDLVVTPYVPGRPGEEAMMLQGKANEFTAEIRAHAATLMATEQSLSERITTATAGLHNVSFAEGGPFVPVPLDSVGTKLPRWTDKDLYPHDPTAADVKQDTIGDCYLDATMGAIANANPQWIEDRIHYDDKTGNFDVTLWDGHQWKHIPITQEDIDTDVAHHGASWRDNGQPNAPLWPSVLESAYAKLKAPPGDNLGHALDNVIGKGGYPKDAMEALTGNRGTTITPEYVWFTNQHIDQEISSALANHQPVTITTTPQGAPLEHNHVYVVEGISGTGSDAQVTLRNPWETNLRTPINTSGPLVTVRLGDLIGSGLTGNFDNGSLGTHPTSELNIGSLG